MLSALALVTTLSLGQALPPWMTGESRPEDLTISLVTFSPGDSLVEWWGHTSFVIEDRRLNKGLLYNFGMFGPRTPGDDVGFVKDFIKGRLIFWVDAESIAWTFNFYRDALKRDVRVQELDLEPAEAMAIAKRLGTHVLPDNKYYRYHHYDDNCSTRPRDIIDEVIGGQLKAATSAPSKYTLRQHTLRYSYVNPPMSWILDFLQADRLDKPITGLQDAYLPDELEKQVQALQVKRADGSVRPLVRRQWNYFTSTRTPPPAQAPNWIPYELLIGLALGGIAIGLGRKHPARWARITLGLWTLLVGLVVGILGTALGFLMCFTDHDVTFWNENLWQANPLFLALIPLGVMVMRNSSRALSANVRVWQVIAALSVMGVLIKVLPMADQANGNILAVLVPLNLGFAASWWLQRRAAMPVPEKSAAK
ncbi:MAG: DUF4105 domain-containing protein [Myxococcaceae bacterium]